MSSDPVSKYLPFEVNLAQHIVVLWPDINRLDWTSTMNSMKIVDSKTWDGKRIACVNVVYSFLYEIISPIRLYIVCSRFEQVQNP